MKVSIKIIFLMLSIFFVQISVAYVPAQVNSFLKAIQGKAIVNCSGCDFRGTKDLAGIDAHGQNMPGVLFNSCVKTDVNKNTPMICIENQVADLTGINLANANLFNSCFDGAILVKADLTGADMTQASVIGANLTGAKVSGLVTQDAMFCNSIMPDGKKCDEKLGTWKGDATISCNCPTSSNK